MILLLAVAALAGWFGSRLPRSFLPDEDQGYVFAGLQLPNAASLQRTSDASKKIEDMILKTPGVHSVTTVAGYSMLSGVQNTYSSFFWITLKDWAERKAPDEQYEAIKKHLNQNSPASRKVLRSRFHRLPFRVSVPPEDSPSCWKIEQERIQSS